MTLAFWQAGDLAAAGRAVRDWARVEKRSPDARAVRGADLRGHGRDRPGRGGRRARRSPSAADADAWERVGRLRLRLMDRDGAIAALEQARRLRAHRRGPALAGARLPPGRRRRRRGHGLRAGDAPGARLARRVGALRPRAGADRPHQRAIEAVAAPWGWRRIRRSPTSWPASRPLSRASCRSARRPEPIARHSPRPRQNARTRPVNTSREPHPRRRDGLSAAHAANPSRLRGQARRAALSGWRTVGRIRAR